MLMVPRLQRALSRGQFGDWLTPRLHSTMLLIKGGVVYRCVTYFHDDLLSLLQVDYHNATPTFLGWVVASFSIGMLVSAPLFGLWADYRPSREPLITSMVINILFNLLYAYCGAFPSGIAGWIMMVARFVIGVAAGAFYYFFKKRGANYSQFY